MGQDHRWKSTTKKLMSSTTFSKILKKKIDTTKVKVPVIQKWVSLKLQEILGFEDDVLVGMVHNILDESATSKTKLDGQEMQLTMTGFLDKHTDAFMTELWELLVSAEAEPTGIPRSFLDAKAKEMETKRALEEDAKKRAEEVRLLALESARQKRKEKERVPLSVEEGEGDRRAVTSRERQRDRRRERRERRRRRSRSRSPLLDERNRHRHRRRRRDDEDRRSRRRDRDRSEESPYRHRRRRRRWRSQSRSRSPADRKKRDRDRDARGASSRDR